MWRDVVCAAHRRGTRHRVVVVGRPRRVAVAAQSIETTGARIGERSPSRPTSGGSDLRRARARRAPVTCQWSAAITTPVGESMCDTSRPRPSDRARAFDADGGGQSQTTCASRRRRPCPWRRRVREQLVGQRPHRFERLVARQRRHVAEQPLRLRDGPRRARPGSRRTVGRRSPSTSSLDMGDEADRSGFGRVERFAGEHRRGDLARRDPPQDRHRDDRGRDADAHLGEGERGRVVHDHEVAGRHQPDPAGAHGAVHGGDRRAFGVHQPFEGAGRTAGSRPALRALLEVGAGAERRTRDGVSTIARRVRASARSMPVVQLGQQLARQRIAVVLRVERDRSRSRPSTLVCTTSAIRTVPIVVVLVNCCAPRAQRVHENAVVSGRRAQNFYTSRRDRASEMTFLPASSPATPLPSCSPTPRPNSSPSRPPTASARTR